MTMTPESYLGAHMDAARDHKRMNARADDAWISRPERMIAAMQPMSADEREAYAQRYGAQTAAAMVACRRAARKGDMEDMETHAAEVSWALFRQARWVFARNGEKV